MNFRPLHDHVIAVRDEIPLKIGSIHLPENMTDQRITHDKPQSAVVVAIGPGRKRPDGTRKPMGVKIGDHVVFSRYTGGDVHGLENHIIMRESDVLGILFGDGIAQTMGRTDGTISKMEGRGQQ